MRNEEIASSDLRQMHMGRSGPGVGTVPVCVRVQERAGGEGQVLAGRFVKGTMGFQLKANAARLKLTTARVYVVEGLAKIGYEKPSNKLTFYKAFFSHQWKFMIHTILQCLSTKTTSWNEFSSTMASATICLTTNQKFNLSRYILLSLVKNIQAGVPFFTFSRFVQLIINHQLGDMTHHKEIFDTSPLTKKLFANIKRVGTGFSEEVTLLFDNMSVQAPKAVGILQTDAQLIPITTEPSTSKPQKKHTQKRKHTQESKVPPTESSAKQNLSSPSNDPLPSERLEEENRVLKELKSVHCTYDVDEPITKKEKSSKQGRKIADIDDDVEINLEKAQAKAYNLDLDHQEKVTTTGATKASVPRKIRCVIIQDPEETTTTATVQPKVQAKDKGKAILIKEPKSLKRQEQIKLDEEVARQLEAELNADINWNAVIEQVKRDDRLNDAVNYFKGMTYDEIRPLFEKHYNFIQTFLDEVNKGVKVSEIEVRQEKDVKVESSKREGKCLEQEIAKKQKMKEETEELKKHLQIVTDDDDDVYTDATHLASKILVVDYKIHTERNRPYFKIIRADGNYMLFISFSTMLKNFDREYLESLWKIIRDRFEKRKPKNYSDDYLLNTLKIIFEKPNVEAGLWKDQKGKYSLAKVKSWKFIESCGVHCITFLTTQIFLLIERMYLLTHFTLERMLNNVRLQVDDESEMSLELLRLVKRQLNEGVSLFKSPTNPVPVSQTEKPHLPLELAMMKVIKEGFKKHRLLKISDDSFTYNTPLGTLFNEIDRLSGMDDNLFTYEFEIPRLSSIPCDKKEEDDSDDGDPDIYEPRVSWTKDGS
nr:hypothetical protein [Tanacetum cinerariifolium]